MQQIDNKTKVTAWFRLQGGIQPYATARAALRQRPVRHPGSERRSPSGRLRHLNQGRPEGAQSHIRRGVRRGRGGAGHLNRRTRRSGVPHMTYSCTSYNAL